MTPVFMTWLDVKVCVTYNKPADSGNVALSTRRRSILVTVQFVARQGCVSQVRDVSKVRVCEQGDSM